jgi:hypothetical protein
MPGHISTDIVRNTATLFGNRVSDRQIAAFVDAPVTAKDAAKVILDGVKSENWRILIGEDAKWIDDNYRARPWDAYSDAFYEARAKARIAEGGKSMI